VSVDVVVVGLGGVGSAAAAALARRGQRVLGLDRYPPVHDQGASHGETRIVRKAYFEGAGYVPLLHRAYELWDELGLLHRVGGLFLGAHDSRVLGGTLATAQQWDLPYALLDAPEVTRRFPALTPPPGTVGLLEQDAGWVSPEAAVAAQLERAVRAGADLRHEEPVTAWHATRDGVRVTTERGSYEAGALVLAPGRWAVDLLPDLPVPLRVEERLVHFFPGAQGPSDRTGCRSGSGSARTAPSRTASRTSARASRRPSTTAGSARRERGPGRTWPRCWRRCCPDSATGRCARPGAPTRSPRTSTSSWGGTSSTTASWWPAASPATASS
jgi:glycine/D-amino acid oxidase-like deaminating enzyme